MRKVCIFLTHKQDGVKNFNLKIYNKLFERVTEFRCLGRILTSQNYMREETQCTLNSRNVCCC